MTSEVQIEPLAADAPDAAAELLARFFAEEGFPTPPAQIARNLAAMLADPMCWSALATVDGTAAGVVTVTTMRYVEWGLLGEIGDLYVLPERRGMGIAGALVAAAMKLVPWPRVRGGVGGHHEGGSGKPRPRTVLRAARLPRQRADHPDRATRLTDRVG